MDEADGRPGHVALQSGHLDAPADAPNPSLCLPDSPLRKFYFERKEVASKACPQRVEGALLFAVAHSKIEQYRRTP
jgi:hypothetical protein